MHKAGATHICDSSENLKDKHHNKQTIYITVPGHEGIALVSVSQHMSLQENASGSQHKV
jgi:hypothetical protein